MIFHTAVCEAGFCQNGGTCLVPKRLERRPLWKKYFNRCIPDHALLIFAETFDYIILVPNVVAGCLAAIIVLFILIIIVKKLRKKLSLHKSRTNTHEMMQVDSKCCVWSCESQLCRGACERWCGIWRNYWSSAKKVAKWCRDPAYSWSWVWNYISQIILCTPCHVYTEL